MYSMQGGSKLLDADIILRQADLAQGMRIADFGCGATGHFIFPAAALVGKNGTVYAVDIQRTVLESIKRRARQEQADCVKPVWSNIETYNATNIETASLDIVLLVNTLYQSHKRVNIIREAVRVLKKNGKLIIVEWKKVHIPFGPPVEERVDMNAIKEAAPKLGLVFEKEFFTGSYHYGLVFLKA
jgi:ubiquinone/menaquinone biosynthesis C-methylase UbiE